MVSVILRCAGTELKLTLACDGGFVVEGDDGHERPIEAWVSQFDSEHVELYLVTADGFEMETDCEEIENEVQKAACPCANTQPMPHVHARPQPQPQPRAQPRPRQKQSVDKPKPKPKPKQTKGDLSGIEADVAHIICKIADIDMPFARRFGAYLRTVAEGRATEAVPPAVDDMDVGATLAAKYMLYFTNNAMHDAFTCGAPQTDAAFKVEHTDNETHKVHTTRILLHVASKLHDDLRL